MSSNGVELEQVIHTHSHSWPRGIGEPKSWSSLLNSYFRLSGFQSLIRSLLLRAEYPSH